MINSARALFFTALGALVTALITVIVPIVLAGNSGAQKISVQMAKVDVVNFGPSYSADFSESLAKILNEKFQSNIKPIEIAILSRSNRVHIYNISIKNLGTKRVQKIDVNFENLLFAAAQGIKKGSPEQKFLRYLDDRKFLIEHIDPRQEVEIFAIFSRVPFKSDPFTVLADGSLIEVGQPEIDNDIFGIVSFYRDYPFLAYLSMISVFLMIVILCIMPYGIYASHVFKNDISRYKLITNDKQIQQYRKIIEYIDKDVVK